MSRSTILLPGDDISQSLLPTSNKRRLHSSIKSSQAPSATPSTQTPIYSATAAGSLQVDTRKHKASIPTPRARYQPQAGDLVIAQVRVSSQESFQLHLTPHGHQAILGHLAFEGASKKTRPMLKPGDLVYAKVISAVKGMDVELSCVNPATGKSEPDGLGPLGPVGGSTSTSTGGLSIRSADEKSTFNSSIGSSGGGGGKTGSTMGPSNSSSMYLFDITTGFADRLLTKSHLDQVMTDLGKKIPGGFEVAVGRNGKVWVHCPDAGATGCIIISRVLQEVDERNLSEREQKGLVGRMMGSMGL